MADSAPVAGGRPLPGTGPFALCDGTPATIRVMHDSDRERLIAAFAKLEQDTIYTRFFSFRKEIGERALGRIAEIDFVNLCGLVATVGSGTGETVIAAGTYVVHPTPGDIKTAEVAFTVEEDYQGQGLAGRLLAALAGIARQHAIARFDAEVLSGNQPMLAVFRRAGLAMRTRREGGVTQVEIDLGPRT
jgi:RimJ/RimL family protein N-acetyltransferase